jgi:hypothetical protein
MSWSRKYRYGDDNIEKEAIAKYLALSCGESEDVLG